MWAVLLFGGLAGILASYVRTIIIELIASVCHVQQSSMGVHSQSPAYMRIVQCSLFGPSQTYVFENTGNHVKYGIFIAPKLRCFGYITSPYESDNCTQMAHIWAFGNDSIKRIVEHDTSQPNIYLCNYTTINAGNWSMTRAPSIAREWQRHAICKIMQAHTHAPNNALVCLITGPPGCGKSTIPLLLIRELAESSIQLSRYMRLECFTRLARMSGLGKVVIVIDDQIGDVVDGVVNDKRPPVISMSDWNFALDHVHSIMIGPIIIITSNATYDELCERAGPERAGAMLRPGRIDMILHVNSAGAVEVQRE